jgi:hypothetical protein
VAALIYAREEFFTPDWERFAAQTLLGIEPIEIPGGHFPMIEPGRAGGGSRLSCRALWSVGSLLTDWNGRSLPPDRRTPG